MNSKVYKVHIYKIHKGPCTKGTDMKVSNLVFFVIFLRIHLIVSQPGRIDYSKSILGPINVTNTGSGSIGPLDIRFRYKRSSFKSPQFITCNELYTFKIHSGFYMGLIYMQFIAMFIQEDMFILKV